jgi:TRAP-type C4-dicarboxylate transport system permease small subunit
MDDDSKWKPSILKQLERHLDPTVADKAFHDTFAETKLVSDFVGFIVRMTFLNAAVQYFVKHALTDSRSFYKAAFIFSAMLCSGLLVKLLSNIGYLVFTWGLGELPPNAGVVLQTFIVCNAIVIAFFAYVGSWHLANVLAETATILNAP